jgi:Ca2+-binding RTX toxin-like protein
MANFTGTAGNDPLGGTSAADTFDITQGGADTVNGLGGDDVINAGATFDALDQINGGANYDRLDLTGNYAAGFTLGSLTLRAVEEIRFGAGFSYKVVTHDATVASGAVLKIDGYHVPAGQSLYFDGSAESNGSFLFYDGQSNDTFVGGSKADTISVSYDGTDTVHGGGGDDVISIGGAFTNADTLDGGTGNDIVYLTGNYSLGISAAAMTGIEALGVGGDFVYSLSLADGVVAAGQNLYITAEGMSGAGHLTFNGSSETDGTFSFRDGVGDDTLSGGANGDTFLGVAGGSDEFHGNAGDDTFAMYGHFDAADEVHGGLGHDTVSLEGDYSAGLVFDMFTISNVEDLSVTAGHDYKITTNEANVGPGRELNVFAGNLAAGNEIVFDGSAETDGKFGFYGGAGNDVFTGGGGNDYLDGFRGGNDTFMGGGGDDSVSFFGAYTTDDFVDGGAGNDSMYFYGAFAGDLVLSGAKVKNVESITLGDGFSYNVTTTNSLVAAGATMAFNTYYSLSGQNFVFNGSAETDGYFQLTGGDGNDQLTGGSKADTFFLNRAGNDTMNGGSGDDIFYVSSGFTAADKLNGGAGTDTVRLSMNVGGGLALGPQTLISIETIELFAGQGYTLTSHDGNVTNNALLTVDGHFLGAPDVINFDGSAESNGRFSFLGGSAADILRGGAKNDLFAGGDGNDKLYGNNGIDTLTGGLGADDLYGGNANDKFVFTDIAQTTVADSDTVKDWNAGDKIDLSAIDANSGMAGDQAFTLIGAAAFSGVAGQLQVTAGAVNTFVSGDIDGNGAADFMITVAGTPALGAGAFVL